MSPPGTIPNEYVVVFSWLECFKLLLIIDESKVRRQPGRINRMMM
jgi:hypothetical protein